MASLSCPQCSKELPGDALLCCYCGLNLNDPMAGPLYILDTRAGIFNRSFLEAVVGQEVQRAMRYRRPLTVLSIEIDSVAQVMREVGGEHKLHELLHLLSVVIGERMRDSDTVAFLNGEHYMFGVVLPETPLEGALAAAGSLREMLLSYNFPLGPNTHRISVSIGVAEVNHVLPPPQNLVEYAIIALDNSRLEGIGRISLHHME